MRLVARLAVLLAVLFLSAGPGHCQVAGDTGASSAPPALQCRGNLPGGGCTHVEDWIWRQVVIQHEDADLCQRDEAPEGVKHRSLVHPHPRCGFVSPDFVRHLVNQASVTAGSRIRSIRMMHAIICGLKSEFQDIEEQLARDINHYIAALTDPDVVCVAGINRSHTLDLRDVRIRAAVDLHGNDFRTPLSLGGSYFEQGLNLDDGNFIGDVDAFRLRVDGTFTMVNARIAARLSADGLRTGGVFSLYGSTIEDVFHMRGAIIGGDLDLGNSRFTGLGTCRDDVELEVDRASIHDPRGGMDLSNSQIHRELYMTGMSSVAKTIDMSGITIDGSLWMEAKTNLKGGLKLERAVIRGSLFLGQGTFNSIDLTAAKIDRELRLESGGKPTVWDGQRENLGCGADGRTPTYETEDRSSWLVLRNANIDAIRDLLDAWPDCLTLSGFVYNRPPHVYSGNITNSGNPKPRYRKCVAQRNPASSDLRVPHTRTGPIRYVSDPQAEAPARINHYPPCRFRSGPPHVYSDIITNSGNSQPRYRKCVPQRNPASSDLSDPHTQTGPIRYEPDPQAEAPAWMHPYWPCRFRSGPPPILCFLSERPAETADAHQAEDSERSGGKEKIRPIAWWRNWVERDPDRPPQVYSQLAQSLTNMGQDARADEVRFESQVAARSEADFFDRVLSWVEELLVGFGIGLFGLMSGIWASLGAAAGTWILHTRLRELRRSYPEKSDVLNRGIFWCLFASIQTVIPFVTFSRDIEEFLHKPVVEGEPASTPLRGRGKTTFLALAFFGLLISGALLHSLTRLTGL